MTTTHLDGADPALAGPGGTGGARSVGAVLHAGVSCWGDEDGDAESEDSAQDADVVWARTPLAGPGWLLTALGTPRGVARLLAGSPAWSPQPRWTPRG